MRIFFKRFLFTISILILIITLISGIIISEINMRKTAFNKSEPLVEVYTRELTLNFSNNKCDLDFSTFCEFAENISDSIINFLESIKQENF